MIPVRDASIRPLEKPSLPAERRPISSTTNSWSRGRLYSVLANTPRSAYVLSVWSIETTTKPLLARCSPKWASWKRSPG
jgi:hypothetical protein